MMGCNNKRRFTLRMPSGYLLRFGSCDPKDDDNALIVHFDDKYWLEKYRMDDPDRVSERNELPDNAMWANGYYDNEHDGWKPLSEFK